MALKDPRCAHEWLIDWLLEMEDQNPEGMWATIREVVDKLDHDTIQDMYESDMRKQGWFDMYEKGSLVEDPDSEGDYILETGSIWVKVGNLQVYVKKGDDGVSVEIYPCPVEGADCIAETWALYTEGDEGRDADS